MDNGMEHGAMGYGLMAYGAVEPVVDVEDMAYRQMYGNSEQRARMQSYYQMAMVNGIIKKRMSWDEVRKIKTHIALVADCSKFCRTATYEANHLKVILGTWRCKDKFCPTCNQIDKLRRQQHFQPYLDEYKDYLYHMVLTVPNCDGNDLRATVLHMKDCFKTLTNYLSGNKKVRGIDLLQYGYQGCIRSLEITCKEGGYHPHYHVAIVLGSGDSLEHKHIRNQFSTADNPLFSEFEVTIQRIWWLLVNRKRLTADNILGEDSGLGRYSCVVKKCQPDDYRHLFGYMVKTLSNERRPITGSDFITLYHALKGVRQIQGYGVFYGIKEPDEPNSKQDLQLLKDNLVVEEQPVIHNELWSKLKNDAPFSVLKVNSGKCKD